MMFISAAFFFLTACLTCNVMAEERTEEDLKVLFDKYSDQTGFNEDNLKKLVKETMKQEISDEAIKRAMVEADSDHDGILTFEDFKTMMHNYAEENKTDNGKTGGAREGNDDDDDDEHEESSSEEEEEEEEEEEDDEDDDHGKNGDGGNPALIEGTPKILS